MSEADTHLTRLCPFTKTDKRLVRQSSRHQFHRPSLHSSDEQTSSYRQDANVGERQFHVAVGQIHRAATQFSVDFVPLGILQEGTACYEKVVVPARQP